VTGSPGRPAGVTIRPSGEVVVDSMSDRAIIQQVLAGDVEAFARLVDRHYPRCARIALRIVGNREDAEEAIQDAFLRAFKALGDYEDRERFSAWLVRILVNQCRTVLARSKRRHRTQPGQSRTWPGTPRRRKKSSRRFSISRSTRPRTSTARRT